MKNSIRFGAHYSDSNWGCDYFEVEVPSSVESVKLCYVRVNDVGKISEELAKKVLDTSWMMDLDAGSRRAYRRTVKETAAALVDIFQATKDSSEVGSEFGEIMVSMGSAKALEKIFDHFVLPVAELWKPQVKQNEGFDFHTVCTKEFINFGEAKYSGSVNPHGNAINQAKGFLDEEKHLRDYPHLRGLTSDAAVDNLNNDSFGVVASFSINTDNPLAILENAIATAQAKLSSGNVKAVYLVGVGK